MRTIIYGQSKFLNVSNGLSKEKKALVSEANRLLRAMKPKKHKLRKKIAKNRKRVLVN